MKKLLALVVMSVLLLTVLGCSQSGQYKDGIYQGVGQGNAGQIKVSVEVKKGKISAITIIEDHETPGLLDPVVENTIPEVIKKQTTEGIDLISGATNSSQGALHAIEDALKQAKK